MIFWVKVFFLFCLLIFSTKILFADEVYVSNLVDGTVSVIDDTTNSVIATITVATQPTGVAVNPDNSLAYVLNGGSAAVSVIDVSTHSVTHTITVGTTPVRVAFSPDGASAYVANENSNNISVIDVSTNSVRATLTANFFPFGIAVTPDGNTLYATSLDGVVLVYESETMTDTITVGDTPMGVVFTPDGATAYVTNLGTDDVSVIDVSSGQVTNTISVGLSPFGVAIPPDGDIVYVVNSVDGTVYQIDTTTNAITATITVGGSAEDVAFSADGSTAFVSNSTPDNVSVIDVSTHSVTNTISVGTDPEGIATFHTPPPPPPPPPPSPSTAQIPTTGLSGTSLIVANYLNSLSNVSSLQTILNNLASLSGDALLSALNSIDPLRLSSTNFMLMNTQFAFSKILFFRLSDQRILRIFPPFFETVNGNLASERFVPEQLMASAKEIEGVPAKEKRRCEKYCAWAQGFGLLSHNTGRDRNPSFNTMSGGFLAAYDWFNWDTALVGGGLGYAHNTLDQEKNLGKSTSETALATFYASCFKEMFFIDIAFWGSYNWLHTNRHVFFSGFDSQAKAKFHIWQFTPHLDFGYSFLFSWGAIEPFASLDWPIQFTSKFQETGAAPLNMQGPSRISSMLRSEGGFTIYEGIERETGIFIAKQTLSYVYKKPFSVGQITATIVGQSGSFTVETFRNAQNLFSPSFELFFKRNDGIFGSMIYIGEFGKGYIFNEVLGKVGVYF